MKELDLSFGFPTHDLLSFQEKAIEQMLIFLRENPSHAVYNACEQGLGKTIQAIVTANALHSQTILIICPASVILNWKKELLTWSKGNYKYLAVLKGTDVKEIREQAISVVIISYDLAKRSNVVQVLKERRWDLLILDESHKLKNRASQRTVAILSEIWPYTTYRIALSGTPITDSVMDAYPVFSKMLPTHFKNYYAFASEYAYCESSPYGDKYYGIKNADKLKLLIRKNFFIRYTKEEVLPELPPKVFTKIVLPTSYLYQVPKGEKEIAESSVNAVLKALEGGVTPPIPTSLAGIRKEQALKKLPPIIDFISDLLEQNIPLVVFTYHTDVLNSILAEFQRYNPVSISGDTNAKERQASVSAFQNGETLLFVGQIIAAGTGITLTRSSTVIFAELSWSATDISQAVDRVHRIGAVAESINIYYFSIENSIESRIIDVVVEKAKTFDKLVSE